MDIEDVVIRIISFVLIAISVVLGVYALSFLVGWGLCSAFIMCGIK
jgi:hypothetical protein